MRPMLLQTDIQIVHSGLSYSLPSITMSMAATLATVSLLTGLRHVFMVSSNCIDEMLHAACLPTSANYMGRLGYLACLVWQLCFGSSTFHSVSSLYTSASLCNLTSIVISMLQIEFET